MRTRILAPVVSLLLLCNQSTGQESKPKAPETEADAGGKIVLLTKAQQNELLGRRLEVGLGHSFRDFANVFLVSSRIHAGTGVGLMSSSEEIAGAELMPLFPESYRPTLRQLLDAIALQTSSKWAYDASGKFISGVEEDAPPIQNMAIFEFTPDKAPKPYRITLAEGWKAIDNGHWVMHVPPQFPIGMDIYRVGTYTPKEGTEGRAFATEIRSAIALQWAQRVHPGASAKDMRPAKVGPYEGLYFETMTPSQFGEDIKWRQWVFMIGSEGYFVVSTILPEFEDKIYPDVKAMLTTFRSRGK